MNCNNSIYKGDNTGAFGNNFLTIDFDIPTGYTVSKAKFVCGDITKEFENPVFPLKINLDETETASLKYQNECHLIVWDDYTENGVSKPRKATCDGVITFDALRSID